MGDWLIRLLQGLYHGIRCTFGIHEWVQCSRNAKYDECRHCRLRVRAV